MHLLLVLDLGILANHMSETITHREFSGKKLKALREDLKTTTKGKKGSQSWLAYAIGAHVTSISDWERGDTVPSARYINAMAEALGCDMGHLMGSEDDDEEADRVKLLDAAHRLEVLGETNLADFLRAEARNRAEVVRLRSEVVA